MKNIKLFPPSLQVRIAALVTLVVLLVLFIVGISFHQIIVESIESEVGVNAMDIAHFVAMMPAVQEGIKQKDPAEVLQPIIEQYHELTKTKFIVILNNQGIRFTHPNNELIGKMFTGGDEGPALQGKEYISKANGISGPSIRAFVPIIDLNTKKQLGVVVVGMYETNLFSIARHYISPIVLWLLIGLAVGIFGSIFLARRIKRILHGLEPDQIASLFEEREAILESIQEGVIAVNSESRITLINSTARRLLSIEESALGKKITDVLENSTLPRVVKTEEAEKDLELVVNGVSVLANRTPIKVGNSTLGAVATFRDLTELRILTEELTGVKQYADGLRAKTHEFMNKLQTISGLLELQEYDEAKLYIQDTATNQKNLLGFLSRHIHDSRTSGLLLGKIQQAQELNITVTIEPGSHLEELPTEISSDLIVLVLGNLLENAIEALNGTEEAEISVCILDSEDEIALIVEDNGPGITQERLASIFDKGFSTKGDERGYGLYLVKNQVELVAHGEISVDSTPGTGTSFTVRLPKIRKRGRAFNADPHVNC